METSETELTDTEILSHVFETMNEKSWQKAAEAIASMKFPKRDLDRMAELLDKNQAGTLSLAERDQLDRYVRVGDFLSLLKARAMRHLEQPVGP